MKIIKYYFVLILISLVLGGCASKPIPKMTYQGYEGQPIARENIAILLWEGIFDRSCNIGEINANHSNSQYVKQIDDIKMASLYSFCGGSFDNCCAHETHLIHDYSVELLPGIHQIKYFADFGDGPGRRYLRLPRIITIMLDMKAGHKYRIDKQICGSEIIVSVIDETTGGVVCNEESYSSCGGIQQSNCTMSTGVIIYEISSEGGEMTQFVSSFSEYDIGDCVQVISSTPKENAISTSKIIKKTIRTDRIQLSNSVIVHYINEPTGFGYSIWDEPVKLVRTSCP